MGSDEGGEPVEAGGSVGLGRGMTWRAAAMKTPSLAGSHLRRMKSMSDRGGLAGVAREVLRRAEVAEGRGGRVAPGDGGGDAAGGMPSAEGVISWKDILSLCAVSTELCVGDGRSDPQHSADLSHGRTPLV